MKQSKEFLDIDVIPVTAGTETKYEIRYQVSSGDTWSQVREVLPDAVNRSKNLWMEFRKSTFNYVSFDDTLARVGLSLYGWLFDLQATELLHDKNVEHEKASNGSIQKRQNLRICLELPAELVEFPWEASRSKEYLPIGINPCFTFIRRIKGSYNQNNLPGPLSKAMKRPEVTVIDVDCKGSLDYQELDTENETNKISEIINKQGFFKVNSKMEGSWTKFRNKCKHEGPPAIFHFAGHSAKEGTVLLFRDEQGEAKEQVDAERLAIVLKTRLSTTMLAFLNACDTNAGSKHFFIPYHSLAETLIRKGIPMTVGVQTPILDKDAGLIAEYFYEQLSQGASFDYALQEARKQLWVESKRRCNWPFILGMVAHRPYSFRELVKRTGSSKLDIRNFGFGSQRSALRTLLGRESPTLIIIHGEQRSGHAHLLAQAERELEATRRTYWEPIPEFLYRPKKVGALVECELLAHFADRLGLDHWGDVNVIRDRIIEKLESWLQKFEVVVFQFKKPLNLSKHQTSEQNHILQICSALETILVQLQEGGNLERLSFFFLLPIEYPKLLGQSKLVHRKNQFIQQLENRSGEALSIQLVDELLPFDNSEIEAFLKHSFNLSPEDIAYHLGCIRGMIAEQSSSWLRRIRSLSGFRQASKDAPTLIDRDNEAIIEYIKDLIEFNNE